MNRPSVKHFDLTKAVDKWYLSSTTLRYAHGHERYKPDQNENMGVIRLRTFQKLSTMCLTSIIDSLERFMIEYESGSTVPKMHFEYLQRVYSKTIWRELKNREALKCQEFNPLEYYRFILNPFLKEIDLSWCCKWVNTPIIEHLVTIGNTITNLCIEECRCSSEAILNLIGHVPKVKSLTLRKCNISQSELESIGKHCADLQILNVASCLKVRDIAIEGLCPIEGKSRYTNFTLQQLNVQGTSVTANGIIFALKHFPNMTSITHNCVIDVMYNICRGFEINTPPLFLIDNLERLTTLCGVGFQNENKLQSCIMLCPRITELTLNCITFQAQIDVCMGFTALKKVNFSVTTYMFIDLSSFFEARGGNLEMISIKNGKISARKLIQFCPKLRSLTLCNIEFEPLGGFDVGEFHDTTQHLEELCFKGMDSRVDKAAISINLILSASPNLKYFTLLHEHELTSHFISRIIAHSFMLNVLVIDVRSSCISKENIAMLIFAAPNLQELIYKA